MSQASNDMQGSQGGWPSPEELLFAGVGILQGLSGCEKGSSELCRGFPGLSGRAHHWLLVLVRAGFWGLVDCGLGCFKLAGG